MIGVRWISLPEGQCVTPAIQPEGSKKKLFSRRAENIYLIKKFLSFTRHCVILPWIREGKEGVRGNVTWRGLYRSRAQVISHFSNLNHIPHSKLFVLPNVAVLQFDLGGHGCDRVLMRMRHCSLCAGYPLVYPCPAFCEVSLARCLRPINKLQSSWTNLISEFTGERKTNFWAMH